MKRQASPSCNGGKDFPALAFPLRAAFQPWLPQVCGNRITADDAKALIFHGAEAGSGLGQKPHGTGAIRIDGLNLFALVLLDERHSQYSRPMENSTRSSCKTRCRPLKTKHLAGPNWGFAIGSRDINLPCGEGIDRPGESRDGTEPWAVKGID